MQSLEDERVCRTKRVNFKTISRKIKEEQVVPPEIDQSVILKNAEGHKAPVHASTSHQGEMQWKLPLEIGTGMFRTMFFHSGLSVTISHCHLHRSLHANMVEPADTFLLVFPLEGRSINTNGCFKSGFEMETNQNLLYRFPDGNMTREGLQGQTLASVVISIPKDRLLHEHEELLTGKGKTQEFTFEKDYNSPAMNLILRQMVQCRLSGQIRQFFLESKALELLALKLEMIQRTPTLPPGISEEQAAVIFTAKDLLLSNIATPPSIHDLSRAAGMSHPKLQQLFRTVFGCSPFDMLREKRLEWAKELVEKNEMSLTEIAYELGYSGSSHFSRAFSDRFGVQPSKYRRDLIGNPFYSLP